MRAPASLPDPRLRRIRTTHGITIRDLAEQAGCSYRHLQMVELGRRPSLVLAHRLATALTSLTGRDVEVSEFYDENPDQGAA